MGFFSKAPKKEALPWIQLSSVEQLSDVLHNIKDKPVLLFKHSTRCSISSMALNGFERNWSGDVECELYYLDLLKHRDISQKIAELTGVVHQSPQAIVIKGKEIVYEATHSGIDASRIESILRKG